MSGGSGVGERPAGGSTTDGELHGVALRSVRHRGTSPHGLLFGAALAVCVAVAALPGCTGLGGGGARGRSPADREAAGEEVTGDGAWCWFADPRAVSFSGEHDRTYTGWVDASGYVWVASIDNETGEVVSSIVKGFGSADDHANPSILVRPTGHLTLFYSDHGGAEIFVQSSMRAEDVTSWNFPASLKPSAGMSGYGYTYPCPVSLSEEGGATYLFYRNTRRRPAFIRSLPGGGWSGEHVLFGGDVGDAYVKYDSDGVSEIRMAFTDGHPRGRPVNNVYYARYSGGAFFRADGSVICGAEDLPMEPGSADLVFDSAAADAGAWVWDVAADSEGRPVIVYAVFPREADHRYHYARWDGAAWSDHELVSAGGWFPRTPLGEEEKEVYYSAGITLDHDDPSVLYLSRRVGRSFEIERWQTADGGVTWDSSPVTENSLTDNVRPVVPRGSRSGDVRLLWMSGTYVGYTDFSTAIRMLR